MKLTHIAIALACTFAVSVQAGDRSLFSQPVVRAPLSSTAHAPIDKALGRIIPVPYRILLDGSVPTSVIITWQPGDNWMAVLSAALAPIGLVAVPDWSQNSITVTWRQANSSPSAPPTGAAVSPKRQPAPVVDAIEPTFVNPQTPAYASAAPIISGAIESPVVNNRQPSVMPTKSKMTGAFSAVSNGGETYHRISPRLVTGIIGSADHSSGDQLKLSAASNTDSVVSRSKPVFVPTSGVIGKADKWALIRAAVEGRTLVIAGYSGASTESGRIWWANSWAKKVKAVLEDMGIPSELISIQTRTEYKTTGDKPHAEITMEKREF